MAHVLHVYTGAERLGEALCLGLQRPFSPAPFPGLASGETEQVELRLVTDRGTYDARSGADTVDPKILIAVPGGSLLLESTLTSTGENSWTLKLDCTTANFLTAVDEGDVVAAYTIQLIHKDEQTTDVLARGPVLCCRPAYGGAAPSPEPANAIRFDDGYIRFDDGYVIYA